MEFAIKNGSNYESVIFSSFVIQTQGLNAQIKLMARLDGNDFAIYKKLSYKNTLMPIDLPFGTQLKLVSSAPFQYSYFGQIVRYHEKTKISDFLYEIQYGNIDYDYAYENFFVEPVSSGCSAIRNGQYFGRNFDWLYDNHVTFVVHTPKSLSRYGVLGVSGIVPGITVNNASNEEIIVDGIDMFKLLPFYLLDGINDMGVFCTYNIVPLDDEDEPTTEVHAKVEELDRIPAPMLARFILDKFSSAQKAIDYIVNYTTIYFSQQMIDAGYQCHFLIGDNGSTYVIEFTDNEIDIYKSNYITNFNIDIVQFSKDNKIQYPPTLYGMNKYGFGLERWDIISNEYSTAQTLSGMIELLDNIKYQNGYNDSFRVSELVKGIDDESNIITVDTLESNCSGAISQARLDYANRDRDDPKTWITCHSSVYDIYRRKLYIKSQEEDIVFEFLI